MTADTTSPNVPTTETVTDEPSVQIVTEGVALGAVGHKLATAIADRLTARGWNASAVSHQARAHNDVWSESAVRIHRPVDQLPPLWKLVRDDARFRRPSADRIDDLLRLVELHDGPSDDELGELADALHQLHCACDTDGDLACDFAIGATNDPWLAHARRTVARARQDDPDTRAASLARALRAAAAAA